ncbi:MAG: GNAT family N-acetyltransferase [Pseudomonadota bacterium]
MNVDHANRADLADIIDLRGRAFLQLAPQFYSSAEVKNLLADYTTAQILNMIADKRLFCYRLGDRLSGTCGWEEDRLRHLYVDPEFFGHGIGTALLEHTVADFRARTRHRTIQAGVILYARGFYEKCGFQVVSKERAWDGSEYYSMQRNISPQLHF